MSDITTSSDGNRSTAVAKKLKRLSTRVDLTPMVDLGFLLITFFVFTTSMNQATVMNMNETKDGDPTEIQASGAMTILLGGNHQVFYYYQLLKAETSQEQFKRTDFKNIRQLILDKKNKTDMSRLMFIIKADKRATFKDVIDIIDEMIINGIPAGHYAETDISKEEAELIAIKSIH